MAKQSAMHALMISALAASLAGCATSSEPPDLPLCSPPPQPALPTIDAGTLWDRVGDDMYRRLEERDARLTGWALEMQAQLDALCQH